jgi:hypothetical protein
VNSQCTDDARSALARSISARPATASKAASSAPGASSRRGPVTGVNGTATTSLG